MGEFSIWHWLIVLALVLLVFGTKKLRTLGPDLGAAIKGFKDSMKSGEAEAQSKEPLSSNMNQLGSQHAETSQDQKTAEQHKA